MEALKENAQVRIKQLADELDRLKMANIGERCQDKVFANDMSMILAAWIVRKPLEHKKLMVVHGHFKSRMSLYTAIMRALGHFCVDGLSEVIDQYLEYYSSLKRFV